MFIDKVFSLVFGILFLLVLSCDGPSNESVVQGNVISGKNRPLLSDPVFWDYAASSNMLQAELGNLAAEKGSTAKVQKMGKKSFRFHSHALQQMRALVANEQKIQLPDSLGSADHDLVEELRKLEGEEFNTRYRDFILSSHQKQLERYREALGRAENQKTQAWLQAMLVHLREELDTVNSDLIVQQ